MEADRFSGLTDLTACRIFALEYSFTTACPMVMTATGRVIRRKSFILNKRIFLFVRFKVFVKFAFCFMLFYPFIKVFIT